MLDHESNHYVLFFKDINIFLFFFRFGEQRKFEGALAPNTHLQRSDRIYQNEVLGPESIVVDGGINIML